MVFPQTTITIRWSQHMRFESVYSSMKTGSYERVPSHLTHHSHLGETAAHRPPLQIHVQLLARIPRPMELIQNEWHESPSNAQPLIGILEITLKFIKFGLIKSRQMRYTQFHSNPVHSHSHFHSAAQMKKEDNIKNNF